MKFSKTASALLLAAGCLSPVMGQVCADADRFSPLVQGYMERARTMRDGGNYAGVIDQLKHLHTQGIILTDAEAEEYTFLLADACYHRGDADCLRLLEDFLSTYPASPYAPEASVMIGDYYFFAHDWASALAAYDKCDAARLNGDQRAQYDYRRTLCLIKTGHFEEARGALSRIHGIAEYSNAYTFYSAYLDYIDGHFDRAYTGFSSVPEGIKGLDSGYYLAQIEYSRGDYPQVISRGTSLLRKNPDPELAPEIERIVGLSYFKQNDYGQASHYLSEYLAGTAGEPEPDAIYALGAIDYAEGRYNAARQRFADLTDRTDDIGQGAWLYLGMCHEQQDNSSSAALAFEKAYRLNYDRTVSETALYNYVTAITRGGKVPFSSSSQLLEEFVATYPNSPYTPEVESYLATAYYNDRNYTKALRYIDSIRNPSAATTAAKQKILYELGIESVSNGRSEEGARYLQQCVDMKTGNRNLVGQASLWLGDALFNLGNYKGAANAYRAFIGDGSTQENRALGYYDLGYALYKLEDYRNAAQSFEAALSTRPGLESRLAVDARIRLGDCLYYTCDYDKAIESFTSAISAATGETDYALYRRAILYGLRGNTQAKIGDLTRAEREYPQSRWLDRILLEEAVTYEETGRAADAADAYKKRMAAGTIPDIDELLRMASTINKAERWDDLLDVTDKIRHAGGLEPDEAAEIDLYEADALRALGRTDESAQVYARLAGNISSLPGAKAAVTLAEIDLERGDFDSALTAMEKFTDTGTSHQYWLARGFLALADAYYAKGDKALAKEYVTSLRDNYPGTEQDIKNMISTRLSKWR